MNGWQRLGAVLSMLWLICVSGFAFYESYKIGMPLFSTYTSIPELAAFHAREANLIEIDRTSIDMARSIQLYEMQKKATSEDERQRLKAEMEKVHDVRYFSMINATFAVAVLCPILTFWILSYLCVWALKWIKAGFSQPDATKNRS